MPHIRNTLLQEMLQSIADLMDGRYLTCRHSGTVPLVVTGQILARVGSSGQ